MIAGLLAVTGVGPAPAQPAQTVEGAQKFLSLTIKGVQGWLGDEKGNSEEHQFTVMGAGKAPCTTVMFVSGTYQGRSGLYWSRVPTVRQSGEYVSLIETLDPARVTRMDPRTTITIRLNLRSEALAARTAFAMEFLRQACDPAEGTGF